MKSLDFRSFEALMVLRENKETPADQDWDAFLEALSEQRTEMHRLRVVVFTDGGGPNAEQRRRLKIALGGGAPKVAVITESATVRFIVSSIALINKHICTYSPQEVAKAYAFLELDARERRNVDTALVEMGRSVG